MIHPELLRKNIRDSWWLWFWCALTLFNLGWLHVWVTSRMNTESFQLLLDNFQFMERMLPVSFAELVTYSGRISQLYSEPVVLICVLLWGISRGSDIVSGQLNRGTMEMILAQPVSRMQVFWSHALVTLAGAVLLPWSPGAAPRPVLSTRQSRKRHHTPPSQFPCWTWRYVIPLSLKRRSRSRFRTV